MNPPTRERQKPRIPSPGAVTSPPGPRPPSAVEAPQRTGSQAARLAALRPLQDVNAYCLEMLVRAARTERADTPSLVGHLQDLLRRMTPEMRARAAERSLLLVDMHFASPEWWQAAKDHPSRAAPIPTWRGTYPNPPAAALARAALNFAWHTARADPEATCLLGMVPKVCETISTLSLLEIDQLLERRFRHVRPRWEDRPAVWRSLLLAAETNGLRRMRSFNLYSLQLLIGEMWSGNPAPKDTR